MHEIDRFLLRFNDSIEIFGLQTSYMHNKYNDIYYDERAEMSYKRHIDEVHISDAARRKPERVGIQGVTPTFLESYETKYVVATEARKGTRTKHGVFGERGGISLGESLYNAAGSQSMGVSEYHRKHYKLDSNNPKSQFILDVHSNKWGSVFFELRSAFALSRAG